MGAALLCTFLYAFSCCQASPIAQAHLTLIKWCQQAQMLTGTQNQATDTTHSLVWSLPKTTLQMSMMSVASENRVDLSCFSPKLNFCAFMKSKRGKYLFFKMDFVKSYKHFFQFRSLLFSSI